MFQTLPNDIELNGFRLLYLLLQQVVIRLRSSSTKFYYDRRKPIPNGTLIFKPFKTEVYLSPVKKHSIAALSVVRYYTKKSTNRAVIPT